MTGIELGLDTIDPAEMYGYGRAEELVGRVVKRVGRESVFLITKMLPEHLKDKQEVLKYGKASLRRLGVSEVDLYLIHRPNTWLSIAEQIRNFEVLVDEGLTRY
ncbi:MAG: aldo/keto reductase, partial [Zestosphaera sp.]